MNVAVRTRLMHGYLVQMKRIVTTEGNFDNPFLMHWLKHGENHLDISTEKKIGHRYFHFEFILQLHG